MRSNSSVMLFYVTGILGLSLTNYSSFLLVNLSFVPGVFVWGFDLLFCPDFHMDFWLLRSTFFGLLNCGLYLRTYQYSSVIYGHLLRKSLLLLSGFPRDGS